MENTRTAKMKSQEQTESLDHKEATSNYSTILKKKNHKKVLIYCADITGHRHLYSAYFIRFYLEHGCEVFFCYAGKISRHLPSGRKKYEPSESPYLDTYKGKNHVHMRNICNELNRTKNETNLIRGIQAEIKADVSLYVDGDILRWVFLRQLLPWQARLLGRNFCIICLSEFIYSPGGKLRALREIMLFIKNLFFNRADLVGRGLFVRKFPLLNIFLVRYLYSFNLFTGAFCLDPKLVKQFNSKRILFLPELIVQGLDVKISKQKSDFNKKVELLYRDFLNKHKDKYVLLMFGDLEPRKGFDLLLELTAHEPDCVCVRFGRTKSNYHPTWEVILNKEKLIVEERIFELDIYLESQELIDFIFSSVKFMILPYKKHSRSSGLMMAVLNRDLPVLTADRGAMGYIVKHYGVGRLFREGNFQSLLKEFLVFKNDYKKYRENIKKFKLDFSKKSCDDTLSITLE